MTDRGLFTLIFTGIWCLLGVIFLCVGLGLRRSFLRREERLRARAPGRVAEVVRRDSRTSEGRSTAWYPIIEFEADGRTISLESGEGDGRKRFYEGQAVEVLYDPDDPSCFRLEGFETTNLVGKIFTAIGLASIVIGVGVGLIVNSIPGFMS